ncbi:hypothetical protein ABIB75_004445 [Bradyrhizobium sp. GM2.2]
MEAGRSCGEWGDSVRRIIDAGSCPGRAATPLRVAAQSRDPCPASALKDGRRLCSAPSNRTMLRSAGGCCAASGARTHNLPINLDPTCKQQTHLRILAAHFARALPDRIALVMTRAQGRPGAGWHPQVRAPEECTRGGPQVSQSPGLPCAVVYGLLRALPGERCTIAPVAPQMADASARSGSTHHHRT